MGEVDGKMVRLMKIRNPWGERAPRTWKGAWGKDSPKWTFELKRRLGVVNNANIAMEDEMSVFWMAYEDVKNYFAAIEVCRVHPDRYEQRLPGWLPSGVGPGESFDMTVFRKTQVDVVIWQERHIAREGALGAKSTNIDVGFAILRRRGTLGDGLPDYELVEYAHRTRSDDVSLEMILDGGYVYRIVPLSFGMIQEVTPRRGVLVVHSVEQVEVRKSVSTWHDIACAMYEGCRLRGKRRPVENGGVGLSSFIHYEDSGVCFAAENATDEVIVMQIDSSDSTGVVSSRGSQTAIVALPSRSRQVLFALAPAPGAVRIGMMVQAAVCLEEGAASFAMQGEGLHLPIAPVPPDAKRPRPDEDILRRAPPERPRPQSAAKSPKSDDDDLAAALQLSLQGRAHSTSGSLDDLNASANAMGDEDDNDDLALAIRMSMAGGSSAAPPQPSERPSTADEKKALTERVKVLFEEYRRGGMPPSEAAVKALDDARRGK